MKDFRDRENAPPDDEAALQELYGTAAAHDAAVVVRSLAGRSLPDPVAAIVLGSGLGGLAERITDAVRIPFHDIPGFPPATVEGHAGALILGQLGGKPVVCLAGRFHLYEAHPAAVAVFPIRLVHALGARILIVSNAAGGVRRTFVPGTLMRIDDHINMMNRHPLAGPQQRGELRFPDMSAPYDRALGAQLDEVARTAGVRLDVGVYCGLLGPTYETPAEVRMVEKLGGDAVGMSTVPEVITARALGMRCVGVTLITNAAAGYTGNPLNHAEVLHESKSAAGRFETLITSFVGTL
ncbi:MAG TPA: purine-nucleoside phosphorylase [Gemmatimonadaceae bacterium]|nr:purine-nucleoside phosphorylase [Gemmatimonadaceae bacterium]